MSHALVIGGTGMLKDASLWLSEKYDSVSVVGRSEKRLQSLVAAAEMNNAMIHPLAIDYRNGSGLRRKVEEALSRHGEISLVLSWIHSTAPEAHSVIAELLAKQRTECEWYDLLGSAAADPTSSISDNAVAFKRWSSILYRSIVLGFIIENGNSRWLTHAEISGGVIHSMQNKLPSSVIGQVHPWSKRP